MPMLFKFLGLALIFLTCVSAGYIKSLSLRKKSENLRIAANSVAELAGRIKIGGEICELISVSFESSLVKCCDGKITVNRQAFFKEEADLLEEFFGDIGMRDSLAEQERTAAFADILTKRHSESLPSSAELCRLYNSIGVLGGIFLCIFFL